MLPRIPVGHQLALGTMRDYRERPLCGGHFKTVNDWLWPISDRFSPPNRPFNATNPGP